LLLVDMSASVTESDQVGRIVAASNDFIARVEKFQKVAVYAFDGSPNLYEITPFTEDEARAEHGVEKLNQFVTKDPSTNLHGAIVQALDKLKTGLKGAKVPLRFGTLVVFTDGTDRAHRVSNDEVRKTLDTAQFDTFAIGVGAEVDKSELSAIGRSGTFASQKRGDIARGFDEVAARIEAASRRFYLLSYCSPSRAGEHDVEVEAVAGNKRGRLSHHFDANGFGPRCDPNQKPAFDVRHPRLRTDPDAGHAGR
jgi:hypothetical protein